ncbi:hypothetical protein KY284_031815 [Solanum tuberosum]|nr:hypothetical protein KY284_031815 [Solanum tuberosum]
MAVTTTGGTIPLEEFPPLTMKDKHKPPHTEPAMIQYASLLKSKTITPPVVAAKPVIMLHGEPSITWKASEAIPGQCGIKSECTIGVLDTRHILIRLTTMEDYVHLLSSSAFYVKAKESYWQMRTLKWDPWFEPDVETTIGIAWISFPDLPPNFFAKEAIFSIANAVGKSLTVDMATKNQTRPSCARVKIEVDLIAKLPQRVRINEEDDIIGEVKSKWIKVQYDYIPKYCKECCLQGHDEHNCWTIHPELYEAKREYGQQREGKEDLQNMIGTVADQRKMLTSGKVVGNKQNRQEWMDKDTMENMTNNKEGKSTKKWVENTFEHKEKEDMLKVHEIQLNEGKHDNTETKQCDTEDVQNIQGEKEAMTEQNEGAKYETDKECALVIVKINDEEVIPLAMQMDNDGRGMDQNMNDIENEDLSQNIRQMAIEGLLEPFEDKQEIEEFSKRLGMKHAVANANGKIWAFIDEILDSEVIRDEDQMLTIKLHNQGLGIEVMVSLVYAKCTQRERLQLWESMYDLSCSSRIPWVAANEDYEMLNELPHVVTSDKNEELQQMPMMEEVKSAVMGLNQNTAGVQMEIIAEIRKRGKPPNLVNKLDMMKAYDMVEWLFLTKVLRRLGFGDRIIDMVFKLISNNWYSILLNGQPKGFFNSSRGLKQGDPLSPTLFILAAKVMSRSLNVLMKKNEFKRFGMPRGSLRLNHLAFADDMIILCKTEVGTMTMISETLRKYEEVSGQVSGQKVNKDKSAIYLHHNVQGGESVVTPRAYTLDVAGTRRPLLVPKRTLGLAYLTQRKP